MKKSDQPIITIIVPVYNVEKYLKRCIDSLVVQELECIEIILIDDGSSDRSGEICEFYAKKDNRIQVVHEIHHGPSYARNKGLGLATGEYICFVDSDDEVNSSMMKEMYKIAKRSNREADVVVCNFMNNSTGEFRTVECGLKDEYLGKENIKDEILKRWYDKTETGLASVCNKMYRRSILETYDIQFDEELVRAEDYFFNFSVFRNAECVRSTKEPYYLYYQDNSNSIMHTVKKDWYWHWKKKHVRLIELNEELNFDIDEKRFWKPFSYNTHLYIMKIMHLVGSKENKEVRQIMEDELFCRACKIYSREYMLWVRTLDKLISIGALNTAYMLYRSIIILRRLLGKAI